MHELSVASDLLDFLLQTARENGAATVKTATLRVGVGSCLNPDSLAFGFEALAAGTPAEGCRLDIVSQPAPVACPTCGWSGETRDLADLICPGCGGFPLRVLGGRELTVESVTVE